ncbi:MAG: hypothetical protein CO150_07585 [Nitrospirae bacterium CG_4_9_14_3_um_filter_53_35]|nr:MAG: hypothetical protein AUK29_04010 [Nitrospirae bacterium CG2_30_53_67]PIS37000.1 MAG: hypothetical protein COT35_08275 [Nitrospirae bacterium CG08_land_8_20_14_0_20_52_24]PIV82725.1 MAG: hypothetical protein COW52_12000 [Nitrospirae bacterium CG17_big_fil_post_rev_8_21_14_2_50_50_9]PIW85230.1 MAG: hypothetical protein COZ95_05665 [Nitrospirae bacterium CG_4_8_14_3_um_filter_50_41]PIX85882.1 MAG: hypothetical protein COZ32_06185 [Nitrospirae bacterium CG_4_10_14_3_um_filter_53_41]PJA7367
MQIYFEQEGRLENTPLSGILKSLCDRLESGMLTIEQDEIKKSIYLNNGNIVFATSNWENDRLGIFLFQHGKLTLEDFERSSELMTPNRRHGEILVELGVITQQNLNWAVKEQVKEIIMSLFHWDRGSYTFISMDPLKSEPITLKAKTLDLILDGTRRITSWKIIQSGIGSLDARFRLCESNGEILNRIYMKPKEKKVVEALHQARSVREICNELEIGDFEICRILMGLQAVGIIEKAASRVETC